MFQILIKYYNMNLLDAIFNRRSIRQYTNQKVSDELLEKIIEIGMYAPSAVNKHKKEELNNRN